MYESRTIDEYFERDETYSVHSFYLEAKTNETKLKLPMCTRKTNETKLKLPMWTSKTNEAKLKLPMWTRETIEAKMKLLCEPIKQMKPKWSCLVNP